MPTSRPGELWSSHQPHHRLAPPGPHLAAKRGLPPLIWSRSNQRCPVSNGVPLQARQNTPWTSPHSPRLKLGLTLVTSPPGPLKCSLARTSLHTLSLSPAPHPGAFLSLCLGCPPPLPPPSVLKTRLRELLPQQAKAGEPSGTAHSEALPQSTTYTQLRHDAPRSFSPEAALSAPGQTQASPGTLPGPQHRRPTSWTLGANQ